MYGTRRTRTRIELNGKLEDELEFLQSEEVVAVVPQRKDDILHVRTRDGKLWRLAGDGINHDLTVHFGAQRQFSNHLLRHGFRKGWWDLAAHAGQPSHEAERHAARLAVAAGPVRFAESSLARELPQWGRSLRQTRSKLDAQGRRVEEKTRTRHAEKTTTRVLGRLKGLIFGSGQ